MNRALKVRLTAFAMVIITLAAAIGFAAYSSWREVGRLQMRLSTGHLRSFEIADHPGFSSQTPNQPRELRTSPRFQRPRRFHRDSSELDKWISQQKPVLNSAPELALLNQIDAAFDRFRTASSNALNDVKETEDTRLGHIAESQKAVAPLFELGYQLADAHRQTLEAAF